MDSATDQTSKQDLSSGDGGWGALIRASLTPKRLVLAGVLLLLEVVVCQQFLVAISAVGYGLVSLVVAGMLRLVSDDRARTARWLTSGLLYLTVAGVSIGSDVLNINVYGPWADEQVLEALEAHRQASGRYPDELKELAPAHIRWVPPARLGLFGSGHDYRSKEEGREATLIRTVVPPFARKVYALPGQEARFLD